MSTFVIQPKSPGALERRISGYKTTYTLYESETTTPYYGPFPLIFYTNFFNSQSEIIGIWSIPQGYTLQPQNNNRIITPARKETLTQLVIINTQEQTEARYTEETFSSKVLERYSGGVAVIPPSITLTSKNLPLILEKTYPYLNNHPHHNAFNSINFAQFLEQHQEPVRNFIKDLSSHS